MKFIKLFVVKNSKQLLSYSSFIQEYAKEHPLVAQAMAFMDKYSEIDEDDKSKVKMEKLAICFNQFNFQTTYEKFDKYFDVLHKKNGLSIET